MGVSFNDFIAAPKPKRSPLKTLGRGSESESTVIAPDQHARQAEQAARPLLEKIDLPGGTQKDLNQGVQGATFGWSDEGLAGLQSLFRGETYDNALARERQGLAQFQQDHPHRALGAQLVGGAAASAAIGPLARAFGAPAAAVSIPGRVARAGLQGAVEGGLAGAGSAEGGTADRVAHGTTGALFGGLLGAGVVGTGEAASRLMRMGETPQQAGDRLLSEAMGRDNMTVNGALQAAQEFSDDKPATILDLGGRNTQRLGRTVRTNVGRGSNELDQGLTGRMLGTEERIQGDIAATIGLGPRENAFRKAEEMIADRSATARPLYEKAYAGAPINDPEVLKLLQLPEFAQAYNEGRAIAKLKDGIDLPELGTGPIPVQGIDYLKRGMDDVIAGKMQQGGMGPTKAGALRGKVREILDRVDAQRPDYKAARAQFAGDSDLMEAFETGRKVFSMKSGAIERELEQMSPGERELFRKGGMDALYDRVEERLQSRNPASLTERTVDRKRVRALFENDDDFAAFQKRLGEEATMHRTRTTVQGGSNTADKIVELADMAELPIGAVTDLLSGNVGGITRRVLNSMVAKKANQWRQGVTTARSDALSTRLAAGLENRQSLLEALKEIQQNTASSAARPVTRLGEGLAAVTRYAGPGVAGAAQITNQRVDPTRAVSPPAFPASAGQARTPQEEEARRRFELFMQAGAPRAP